jgi:hypothetical protein
LHSQLEAQLQFKIPAEREGSLQTRSRPMKAIDLRDLLKGTMCGADFATLGLAAFPKEAKCLPAAAIKDGVVKPEDLVEETRVTFSLPSAPSSAPSQSPLALLVAQRASRVCLALMNCLVGRLSNGKSFQVSVIGLR